MARGSPSYDVLIELYEAPERRLRMAELARRVVPSRVRPLRLVDRLEAEGLLTRNRVGEDQRGAWPVYERGILRYFASALTEDEIATLARLLSRIATGLT
jgi:hypothetical protein